MISDKLPAGLGKSQALREWSYLALEVWASGCSETFSVCSGLRIYNLFEKMIPYNCICCCVLSVGTQLAPESS